MKQGYSLDKAYLICPNWPNAVSPATEQEALQARDYSSQLGVSPCVWTSSTYDEDEIDQIHRNLSHNKITSIYYAASIYATRSAELQRKKKNFRCLTHDAAPEAALLRKTAFYYRILAKLKLYWEDRFVVNQDGQYPAHTFRMFRVRKTSTLKDMWNG